MLLALSDTAGLVLLVLGGIFVVAAGGALFLRKRGDYARRQRCGEQSCGDNPELH